MPVGRAASVALALAFVAVCAATSPADPPADSEVSSHIVIGMAPNQGFEVTCEDSVLFMDPVVADELGIIEFQIEGRFGPHPNTVCVRVPAPPSIAAEQATDVCDLAARILWTTDRPATSQVEYGTTQAYGTVTPENQALVVSHSVLISGLSPETTYHYRVVSSDAFGNRTVGLDRTFTTLPPAPTLSDVRAESITESTFVAAWTTNRPCKSMVEYGLTTGYGMATTLTPEFATEHAVLVEGLEPATTYHFRVRSFDQMGGAVCSGDHLATTALRQLVMTGLEVEDVTASTATISWQTSTPATSWVVYGLTSDYGDIKGSDAMVTEHTVVLTGLEPSSGYRFRAFSVDLSGSSVESGDSGFTTRCEPLEIDGPYIASMTSNSITLSWTTSVPADGLVEYGLDDDYGQVAPGDTALGLGHEVTVTGLEPATTYHMCAVSSDRDGCTTRSDDVVAETDAPALVLTTPAVTETTSTSATLVWTTSNPSRCYVEYGTTQAYGFQSELTPFHLTEHSVVLSDLAPRTLYHFRVWATDCYGQGAVSSDAAFATSDQDGPGGLLVYGVVARQISPTYVLICWQTNAAATSRVRYGITEDCPLTAEDDEMLTNHCLTLTDLEPDTRYYYRVESQSAAGLTAGSQVYSFRTPLSDNLPPGAPAGLSATSYDSGVRLYWDAGVEYDLCTYRVHRRATGESSFEVIAEVPASKTFYVDTDVVDGWSYEYALSALDHAGNESELSPEVTAAAGSTERTHIWVYPNPVTDKRTTISFSSPTGSRAPYSVTIYDARGRLIREIAGASSSDRVSSVIWDTKDSVGAPVSSGMYFCVVSLPEDALRSKIMVIR